MNVKIIVLWVVMMMAGDVFAQNNADNIYYFRLGNEQMAFTLQEQIDSGWIAREIIEYVDRLTFERIQDKVANSVFMPGDTVARYRDDRDGYNLEIVVDSVFVNRKLERDCDTQKISIKGWVDTISVIDPITEIIITSIEDKIDFIRYCFDFKEVKFKEFTDKVKEGFKFNNDRNEIRMSEVLIYFETENQSDNWVELKYPITDTAIVNSMKILEKGGFVYISYGKLDSGLFHDKHVSIRGIVKIIP